MSNKIHLLDCTLRDGGNGLEELEKSSNSSAVFDRKMTTDLTENLADANIDIIEIGSIQPTNDDRTRFAQYQTIEELSKNMPMNKRAGQIYAGIYRVPDVPVEDIPSWNPELCEAVRVVLRYSELQKSLDFCKALAHKGYKVFIQPMVTMRYTDEDLQMVINAANEMGAYALYFVDSYGCMDFDDVSRYTSIYEEGLSKDIKIGFHAHNNMNMAFSNAVYFTEHSKARDIVVDSCILGMGLGAGNLQTEIIANYLNVKHEKNYNIEKILEACERLEDLYVQGLWGYSLERLVPALRKTAYKYATEYKMNYGLSHSEIYGLLEKMPLEYKYRFTKEYAKKWYEISEI